MCHAFFHKRRLYSDYTACVDIDLWPYLFPPDYILSIMPVLTFDLTLLYLTKKMPMLTLTLLNMYSACNDLNLWPFGTLSIMPVLTFDLSSSHLTLKLLCCLGWPWPLTFPVGDFLSYPHCIWPNNDHVDLELWPYLFPSDCIVSMLPVLTLTFDLTSSHLTV